MAFAEKNRRLLHGKPQVLVCHHRLRHAREGCKLVDHALDLAGLPLDRLCQRLEEFAVVGYLLAEFSAQPFCRKLYRRQGIFDLVCDAPRHIRPGARALRLNKLGNVIERDDVSDIALARPLARNPDGERPLFVAERFLDLVLILALESGFFAS